MGGWGGGGEGGPVFCTVKKDMRGRTDTWAFSAGREGRVWNAACERQKVHMFHQQR